MNQKLLAAFAVLLFVAIPVGIVFALTYITYNPSNSVSGTINPSPAPTPVQLTGNIVLTIDNPSVAYGGSFTLTATLTPARATAVTFKQGGVDIATVTSGANGIATTTFTGPPATYTFTATAATVTEP